MTNVSVFGSVGELIAAKGKDYGFANMPGFVMEKMPVPAVPIIRLGQASQAAPDHDAKAKPSFKA